MLRSGSAVRPVKYTLMHKDVPVIDLVMADDDGVILSVGKLHSESHLPVGTVRYGELNEGLLKSWWRGRSIPASRDHIRSFLMEVNIASPEALLTKSMGLSLSDQYWIKPADRDFRWGDVNFFTNPFSEDVGNLLFGSLYNESLSLVSPDNTSDGVLKKRWKIIDGKRCLLKGGTAYVAFEAYNEVIASIICESLGIPHVTYSISECGGFTVSVCEDFVEPSTEFVNAASVMNSHSETGQNRYLQYVHACSDLGVDVAPFLDRMIVLDYIMENYDRHFGNFGLLRDVDTLEFIGPAPIFDTGSSLRCTMSSMDSSSKPSSKPFRDSFEAQLELVKDYSWIDFSRLYRSLDDVEDLLSGSGNIPKSRAEAIVALLDSNISDLYRHVRRSEL